MRKSTFFCIVASCACAVFVGCSSVSKTYDSYSDWDSNHNDKIERREFVDGYLKQDYFAKWGDRGDKISYQDLFDEIFLTMDIDRDGKLSVVEFNAQIKIFYFGLFNESFSRWDDDSDSSISRSEFNKHVASTNLAILWDTDKDENIADREMAGGMFYICDTNGDGSVNQTELNEWRRNRDKLI